MIELLAAVPALFQTIQGFQQRGQGRRGLANLKRPTYQIPDEAKGALNVAATQYGNQYMPGERRMVARTGLGAANAYRAAQESGNPLEAIAGIQGGYSGSVERIGIESARNQEQDAAGYMNALQYMAQQRDKQWQMNKFSPYADKYNEYREMVGAGQQNIYGGLDQMSATAMRALYSPSSPSDSRNGQSPDADVLSKIYQDYISRQKSVDSQNNAVTTSMSNPAEAAMNVGKMASKSQAATQQLLSILADFIK